MNVSIFVMRQLDDKEHKLFKAFVIRCRRESKVFYVKKLFSLVVKFLITGSS
jgi:hypothetical protein